MRFTNGKNACSFLHTYGDSIGCNCVATIQEPCVFRCADFGWRTFLFLGDQSMDKKLSTNWNDFSSLKTSNQLINYLADRIYGHDKYYHYTSLSAIEAILKEKTFRISPVTRFNDRIDMAQFQENQHRFFSACFSSGQNENLSLWYMYGGMNGKGARLELSRTTLLNLFAKHSTFQLVEYDFEKRTPLTDGIALSEGASMKLQIGDVVYARQSKKDPNKYELKYNTKTHYNFPTIEFERFKKEHNGFYKGSIWYYEKETRLLIEIIGEAAMQMDSSKEYAILAHFDDRVYKKLRIGFAPEIKSNSEIEWQKYPSIEHFIFDTARIHLSEHHGEIEMNLCNRCDVKKEFCATCPKKENKK